MAGNKKQDKYTARRVRSRVAASAQSRKVTFWPGGGVLFGIGVNFIHREEALLLNGNEVGLVWKQ